MFSSSHANESQSSRRVRPARGLCGMEFRLRLMRGLLSFTLLSPWPTRRTHHRPQKPTWRWSNLTCERWLLPSNNCNKKYDGKQNRPGGTSMSLPSNSSAISRTPSVIVRRSTAIRSSRWKGALTVSSDTWGWLPNCTSQFVNQPYERSAAAVPAALRRPATVCQRIALALPGILTSGVFLLCRVGPISPATTRSLLTKPNARAPDRLARDSRTTHSGTAVADVVSRYRCGCPLPAVGSE